jgi:transcriptional regulator of heat shock response
MLNERQEKILASIVQEYVKTAQPIASKTIVENFGLNVSPATVRNDMCALEEAGMLRQPHTSAGRIPTEAGYQYYLNHFVRQSRAPRVKVHLKIEIKQPKIKPQDFLRQITKSLVKFSGESAFATQDDGWNYYTGMSQLMQKPEFADIETMRSYCDTVDAFDEIVHTIAPRMKDGVNVWIGGDNPFGGHMAALMIKYKSEDSNGILGIVGPQRMNYARNIKLLNDARKMILSAM